MASGTWSVLPVSSSLHAGLIPAPPGRKLSMPTAEAIVTYLDLSFIYWKWPANSANAVKALEQQLLDQGHSPASVQSTLTVIRAVTCAVSTVTES